MPMPLWSVVLCVALVELPTVEVGTLKGDRVSGQLSEIAADAVHLETLAAPTKVPLAEVLEIQFPPAPLVEITPPAALVALLDGTKLGCNNLTVAGNRMTLDTVSCGSVTMPVGSVAWVRFGASSSKLDEQWATLLARETKKDLLIIKKGDVLDHLDGVIGEVGDKIKFLLDGEEIPVARDKAFGLIYSRRAAPTKTPACQIDLGGSDVVQAAQVLLQGGAFKVTLASGPVVSFPVDKVRSLDFSAGKVKYLSTLEPREYKYTPYFDETFDYRRDKNLSNGQPLSLGGRTFSRGLAVHSRTLLKYRIAGDFSRFQAMMGIDDTMQGKGGDMHVTISGDGKLLHEANVRDGQSPQPLDLIVTGVRDLEILVDFGGNLSIADHLDLADAKLIK